MPYLKTLAKRADEPFRPAAAPEAPAAPAQVESAAPPAAPALTAPPAAELTPAEPVAPPLELPSVPPALAQLKQNMEDLDPAAILAESVRGGVDETIKAMRKADEAQSDWLNNSLYKVPGADVNKADILDYMVKEETKGEVGSFLGLTDGTPLQGLFAEPVLNLPSAKMAKLEAEGRQIKTVRPVIDVTTDAFVGPLKGMFITQAPSKKEGAADYRAAIEAVQVGLTEKDKEPPTLREVEIILASQYGRRMGGIGAAESSNVLFAASRDAVNTTLDFVEQGFFRQLAQQSPLPLSFDSEEFDPDRTLEPLSADEKFILESTTTRSERLSLEAQARVPGFVIENAIKRGDYDSDIRPKFPDLIAVLQPAPAAARAARGPVSMDDIGVKDGAVIPEHTKPFLSSLRAEVDSSIPLLVTSGFRDARHQAAALVKKRTEANRLQAAGKDPGLYLITNLYTTESGQAMANELLTVDNTVEAMALVIQQYMDSGAIMSDHMKGKGEAVDIRVRRGEKPFTPAERTAIVAAARKLGAKAVDEGDHVHIENLTPEFAAQFLEVAAPVGEETEPVALAPSEFAEREGEVRESEASLLGTTMLGPVAEVLLPGNDEQQVALEEKFERNTGLSLVQVPSSAVDFNELQRSPWMPRPGTARSELSGKMIYSIQTADPEFFTQIIDIGADGMGRGMNRVTKLVYAKKKALLDQAKRKGLPDEEYEELRQKLTAEAASEAAELITSAQSQGMWMTPALTSMSALLGEEEELDTFEFSWLNALGPKIELVGRNGDELIWRQQGGGLQLLNVLDSVPIIGQAYNVGVLQNYLGPAAADFIDSPSLAAAFALGIRNVKVTAALTGLGTAALAATGDLSEIHAAGVRGVEENANFVEFFMDTSAAMYSAGLDTGIAESALGAVTEAGLMPFLPDDITTPANRLLAAKDVIVGVSRVAALPAGFAVAVLHWDLLAGAASAYRGGKAATRALLALPEGESLIGALVVSGKYSGRQELFLDGAARQNAVIELLASKKAETNAADSTPSVGLDTPEARKALQEKALLGLDHADNQDAARRRKADLAMSHIDGETGDQLIEMSEGKYVVDPVSGVGAVAGGGHPGATAALDKGLSAQVAAILKVAVKQGKESKDPARNALAAELETLLNKLKLGEGITMSPGHADQAAKDPLSPAVAFNQGGRARAVLLGMELFDDVDDLSALRVEVFNTRVTEGLARFEGMEAADVPGSEFLTLKSALDIFGPRGEDELRALMTAKKVPAAKQAKLLKSRQKLADFNKRLKQLIKSGEVVTDPEARNLLKQDFINSGLVEASGVFLYKNSTSANQGATYGKAFGAVIDSAALTNGSSPLKQVLQRGLSGVLAMVVARGEATKNLARRLVDPKAVGGVDAVDTFLDVTGNGLRVERMVAAALSGTREGLLSLVASSPVLGPALLRKWAPEDAKRMSGTGSKLQARAKAAQMKADGSDEGSFALAMQLDVAQRLRAKHANLAGQQPEGAKATPIMDKLENDIKRVEDPAWRVALVKWIHVSVEASNKNEETFPFPDLPIAVDPGIFQQGQQKLRPTAATKEFIKKSGFFKAYGYAGEQSRAKRKLSPNKRTSKKKLVAAERRAMTAIIDQMARSGAFPGGTEGLSNAAVEAGVRAWWEASVVNVRRVGSEASYRAQFEQLRADFNVKLNERVAELLGRKVDDDLSDVPPAVLRSAQLDALDSMLPVMTEKEALILVGETRVSIARAVASDRAARKGLDPDDVQNYEQNTSIDDIQVGDRLQAGFGDTFAFADGPKVVREIDLDQGIVLFEGVAGGYPVESTYRLKQGLAGDDYEASRLFQDAGAAGAEAGEVEAAAKAWRELGTESPWFKRWFGGSAVVDEAGEPLVVYHGSRANFDEFNPALGSEYGIYTTPRQKYASLYGDGRTIPLYVNLKNPKIVEGKYEVSPRDLTAADVTELQAQGYDGLVSVADGAPISRASEIVVFDPSQVKSVNNRGTFDDSGRLLFQDAESAGAEGGEVEAAAKAWREQGVESPYFKRWFGESKVPMVVYHGGADVEGGSGRFRASRRGALGAGIYFAPDHQRAQDYMLDAVEEGAKNPAVTSAHVSIKNPLVLRGAHTHPVIEGLLALGVDEQKAVALVERVEEQHGYIGTELQRLARKQGYDGIIQYTRDGEDIAEIVVFDPTQVKSVNNRGTFDDSGRLLYQGAESAGAEGGDAAAAAKAWREQGVESPYFKRWSGGAEVVSADDVTDPAQVAGRPVVVKAYHAGPFEGGAVDMERQRDIGFHVGSLKTVETFAGDSGVSYLPIYAKFDNLLMLPDLGGWNARAVLIRAAQVAPKNGRLLREVAEEIRPSEAYARESMELARETLMDLGYDGIAYTNKTEGVGEVSYAVFDPKQVKSVYNRGTFDDSARILYQQDPASVGMTRADALVAAAAYEKRAREVYLATALDLWDLEADLRPGAAVYSKPRRLRRSLLSSSDSASPERYRDLLAQLQAQAGDALEQSPALAAKLDALRVSIDKLPPFTDMRPRNAMTGRPVGSLDQAAEALRTGPSREALPGLSVAGAAAGKAPKKVRVVSAETAARSAELLSKLGDKDTAIGVAKRLGETTTDPVLKSIFGAVARNLDGSTKFEALPAPAFDLLAGSTARAAYVTRVRKSQPPPSQGPGKAFLPQDITTTTVLVRADDVNEEALAHELLHAATHDKLMHAKTNRTEEWTRFQNLVEVVLAQTKGSDDPWLLTVAEQIQKVPDELITYGLTNPAFQAFLRTAKGVANEEKTLWLSFLASLRGLLGLDKSETSALNQLLDRTDEILRYDSKSVDSDRQRLLRDRYSSRTLYQLDEGAAVAEVGGVVEAKGELGMDKRRVAALLGSSMYSSNLGEVVLKELLQNAFDATKAATSLGKPGDREIAITIDNVQRFVEVSEDGVGMSPDVVKNAFLSIGGTSKEGLSVADRSGGLGMAKMAFLLGPEWVELETVHDGLRTTLKATPDQILEGDFVVRTERIAPPGAKVPRPGGSRLATASDIDRLGQEDRATIRGRADLLVATVASEVRVGRGGVGQEIANTGWSAVEEIPHKRGGQPRPSPDQNTTGLLGELYDATSVDDVEYLVEMARSTLAEGGYKLNDAGRAALQAISDKADDILAGGVPAPLRKAAAGDFTEFAALDETTRTDLLRGVRVAGADGEASAVPTATSGTRVRVKIPENYTDQHTGDVRDIYMPNAYSTMLEKPLIGDVAVVLKQESGGKGKALKLGKNVELPPKLTRATTDWGDVDVYVGSERKEYGTHTVLSSGLYQFDMHFRSGTTKIPFDIVIDVRPQVEPTHPSYPFANTRESFRGNVKDDFAALEAMLAGLASGREAKSTADTFANAVPMQRVGMGEMGGDLGAAREALLRQFSREKALSEKADKAAPIAPRTVNIRKGTVTDGETGKMIAEAKAAKNAKKVASSFKANADIESAMSFFDSVKVDPAKPLYHSNIDVDLVAHARELGREDPEEFLAKMGSIVVEFRDRAGAIAYDELLPENTKYAAGVSVDKGYYGVHVKVPYRAFFLNPFAHRAKTPVGAAESLLHTLLHEAVHTRVSGHNENFTMELGQLYAKMADSADVAAFRSALEKTMAAHWETYTLMRRKYENFDTKNLAKSLDGSKSRDPGRGARVPTAVGDAREGAAGVGGGDGRAAAGGRGALPAGESGGSGGGAGSGGSATDVVRSRLPAEAAKVEAAQQKVEKAQAAFDASLAESKELLRLRTEAMDQKRAANLAGDMEAETKADHAAARHNERKRVVDKARMGVGEGLKHDLTEATKALKEEELRSVPIDSLELETARGDLFTAEGELQSRSAEAAEMVAESVKLKALVTQAHQQKLYSDALDLQQRAKTLSDDAFKMVQDAQNADADARLALERAEARPLVDDAPMTVRVAPATEFADEPPAEAAKVVDEVEDIVDPAALAALRNAVADEVPAAPVAVKAGLTPEGRVEAPPAAADEVVEAAAEAVAPAAKVAPPAAKPRKPQATPLEKFTRELSDEERHFVGQVAERLEELFAAVKTVNISNFRNLAPADMPADRVRAIYDKLRALGVLKRGKTRARLDVDPAETARLKAVIDSLLHYMSPEGVREAAETADKLAKLDAEALRMPETIVDEVVRDIVEKMARYAPEDYLEMIEGRVDYYGYRLKILRKAASKLDTKIKATETSLKKLQDREKRRLRERSLRVYKEERARLQEAIDEVDARSNAEADTVLSVSGAAPPAAPPATPVRVSGDVPMGEGAKDPKGMVYFLNTAKAVLFAFRRADASTGLHELSHVLRRSLGDIHMQRVLSWVNEELAKLKVAPVVLRRSDVTGRLDFEGAAASVIEAEELFARGFERFSREGVVQNSALKEAFSVMKQVLARIYTAIVGSSIDVEISEDMYKLFDEIFGAKAELRIEDLRQSQRYVTLQKTMSNAGKMRSDARIAEQLPIEDTFVANLRQTAFSVADYRARYRESREGRSTGPGVQRKVQELLGPVSRRYLTTPEIAKMADTGETFSNALAAKKVARVVPLQLLDKAAVTFATGVMAVAHVALFGDNAHRWVQAVPVSMRVTTSGFAREFESFMAELGALVIDVSRTSQLQRAAAFKRVIRYMNGEQVALQTGAQRGQRSRSNFVDSGFHFFRFIQDRISKASEQSRVALVEDTEEVLREMTGIPPEKSFTHGALSGFFKGYNVIPAARVEKSTDLTSGLVLDEAAASTLSKVARENVGAAAELSGEALTDIHFALTGTDLSSAGVSPHARRLGALMVFYADGAKITKEGVDFTVTDLGPVSTLEALFLGHTFNKDGVVLHLPGIDTATAEGFENLSSKARLSTLILIGQSGYIAGLFGDMHRTGLSVGAADARAYARYIAGNSDLLTPAEIVKSKKLAAAFGRHTKLTLSPDSVGDYYIPSVVRNSMAAAQKQGRRMVGLDGKESPFFGPLQWYGGYMMSTLIFGGLVARQSFKFMNTLDVGYGIGLIVGGAEGVAAAARLSALTLLSAVGAERGAGAAEAALTVASRATGVEAPAVLSEKVFKAQLRSWAAKKTDEAVAAVTQFFSLSKYRVEVGPVLDNQDFLYAIGGRVYNAQDVRRTFTRAGMYSNSFKELKNVLRADRAPTSVEKRAEMLEEAALPEANRELVESSVDAVAGFFSAQEMKKRGRRWGSTTMEHGLESADAFADLERTGAAITLMEFGYAPEDAARLVVEAMYDYRGSMGPKDRHWVRRIAMPFWSFRKNANEQAANLAASPQGAFRMMALNRAMRFGAETLTSVLYEALLQPYDVNITAMPPAVKDMYYEMRRVLEYGYGDSVSPRILKEYREALPEGQQGISDEELLDHSFRGWTIREGYKGYRSVPADIKIAFRALLAGRSTANIRSNGTMYNLNATLAQRKVRDEYVKLGASMAIRDSPSSSGAPAWAARRLLVQVPIPVLDASVQEMMKHTSGDSLYAMLPDSFIGSAVDQVGSMLMVTAVLFNMGKKDSALNAADFSKLLNALEPTVDFRDYGGPHGELLHATAAALAEGGKPRVRLSPIMARMMEGTLGVELPHEGERPTQSGAASAFRQATKVATRVAAGSPAGTVFAGEAAGGMRSRMYSTARHVQVVDGKREVVPYDYFLHSAEFVKPGSEGKVAYVPYLYGASALTFPITPSGQFNKFLLDRFGDSPLERSLMADGDTMNFLLNLAIETARTLGVRMDTADYDYAAAVDKPRDPIE